MANRLPNLELGFLIMRFYTFAFSYSFLASSAVTSRIEVTIVEKKYLALTMECHCLDALEISLTHLLDDSFS